MNAKQGDMIVVSRWDRNSRDFMVVTLAAALMWTVWGREPRQSQPVQDVRIERLSVKLKDCEKRLGGKVYAPEPIPWSTPSKADLLTADLNGCEAALSALSHIKS